MSHLQSDLPRKVEWRARIGILRAYGCFEWSETWLCSENGFDGLWRCSNAIRRLGSGMEWYPWVISTLGSNKRLFIDNHWFGWVHVYYDRWRKKGSRHLEVLIGKHDREWTSVEFGYGRCRHIMKKCDKCIAKMVIDDRNSVIDSLWKSMGWWLWVCVDSIGFGLTDCWGPATNWTVKR